MIKVGQIWKYHNGYENSSVIILKIEERRGHYIVHIAVKGLPFENTQEIGHMPFEKSVFEKSITELISENNQLPDFQEGYQQWNEAFENEKGGVFTIDIKKGVDFIIDIVNKN